MRGGSRILTWLTLTLPLGSSLQGQRLVHIKQTLDSRIDVPVRTVAYDSATLAVWWRQTTNNPFDSSAPPRIDFHRYMVIVVAMGARPTIGNAFAITSIDSTATSIRVHVRMSSPGNDCVEGMEAQYPVDLVQVPRSNKLVIFDDQYREVACKPVTHHD